MHLNEHPTPTPLGTVALMHTKCRHTRVITPSPHLSPGLTSKMYSECTVRFFGQQYHDE